MRNSLRIIGVRLAVAIATLSSTGWAEDEPTPYPPCDKTPTDAETNAAKGAFAAGQAAYNEGDYDRAINYWSDAYRRDCTAHALLRNLATAYELSGKKKQALLSLKTYLERQPDSPASTQIKTKIRSLEERIAADAQAAETPEEPDGPEMTPAAPPPVVGDAPEPDDDSGSRPFYPLIVAGVGGALGIVGLGIYIPNKSDLDSLEKRGREDFGCVNRNCDPDTPQSFLDASNDARKKTTLGGALGISGLVVASGGLAWYFLQPKKRETGARSKTPVVGAAVTPGYTGVSLSGRF